MRSSAVRRILALVWLTLGAAGSATATALPPTGPGAWRHDALWDDGNAELCAYQVTWPRYGHSYRGRALLVLVKEPWAPDQNVKADQPRPDGFDVLKLNHLRDVPTGVYTYHQLASVFLRRDDARLVKLATSSAEACGLTTTQKVGEGALSVRSYFDGAADRDVEWPAGAVPEDALPALLRDWVVEALPPTELLVFPTLLDSKLAKLAPRRLALSRRNVGELEVPGGRFDAVELKLEGEGEWRSYLFERAAPHRLLELRTGDGTRYRMAKCGRVRYWEMHDPGGEEWLPAQVR
jgi:hypothetical protein